ncbi:hypothetical protein HOLleu_30006 [Holothuria leucospilota]|uniref:Uncharacterized protein n=1 Tax=Holothuria leucospilota TaxID=206669 RepID=A0A9Q1GY71_HOLLE|nr:hypothetical protein HOLleu_30006 [Holothuria leucospilota]
MSKPCKHDNSRRITVRDLTLDMWMIPTIFCGGRRFFSNTPSTSCISPESLPARRHPTLNYRERVNANDPLKFKPTRNGVTLLT